jgi:hypothetical protein
MKTLITNLHLNDAFRFAANIKGCARKSLTLGDVYETFNSIAQVVHGALGEGASATAAAPAAAPTKGRGRTAGSKNKKAVSASEEPKRGRGRPAGSNNKKAVNSSDKPKRGRGRPLGSKNATPGAPRAPRGQRKGLIVDILNAAKGQMAYAAMAKAVIEREGAEGDAAISVHNAVYALLNKMVSDGEGSVVADLSPKTFRLGAVSSSEGNTEGQLELVQA